VTFGASVVAMVLSIGIWLAMGLNFGIDFLGGTTIRTEASNRWMSAPIATRWRRWTLATCRSPRSSTRPSRRSARGDDPHPGPGRAGKRDARDRHAVQDALRTVYPAMTFPSVESVGPKVSGELIMTAMIAVGASLAAILIYIWLRFEWQFSVGAVAALVHDVILTIGVFSLLQIRFDLATIAALLTIIGYSINDTVVIFDRLRENLIKYKQRDLRDVMNLSPPTRR
jgi:preprotein translocase subunit SecF